MMKTLWFLILLMISGLCLAAGEGIDFTGAVKLFKTHGTFEEVVDNIKMAIEERGMLVSGTLHVSDMLNRTGPDLGYQQVFERAESVEFCSASISHQMTQVAPENLVICPFTLSVFIRQDEPEQIYVAYRRLHLAGKAEQVTASIYEMLNGIIEDSIE